MEAPVRRSLGFKGDGKLTEDRDICEQIGKCNFGCVGKVDRAYADSGPRKAIRRPLVEKLCMDKRTQITMDC